MCQNIKIYFKKFQSYIKFAHDEKLCNLEANINYLSPYDPHSVVFNLSSVTLLIALNIYCHLN